jgi:hypothetical protein
MKKLVVWIFAIGIIASATFLTQSGKAEVRKPKCIGYTVIEVDKAVNCKGDTIRVRKQNGFYQLASIE